MTAQNDLDRAIGEWFNREAMATPPREPLARVIESTRHIRPRPALIARIGSAWVRTGSASGVRNGIERLRPVILFALVVLLALALVVAAVVVGSRLPAPPRLLHSYVNEFVAAPDLPTPMAQPALTLLDDGRVLVIGKGGDGGRQALTALVYDPATGASVTTGPIVAPDELRGLGAPLRLLDGRVLFVGAGDYRLFDPTTMQFASVGPTGTAPRWDATAALLSDGRVLVAGGSYGTSTLDGEPLKSAELFDPRALTFSATGSMAAPRKSNAMVTLPDGRVFVAPGVPYYSELYDPGRGTFAGGGSTSEYVDGIATVLADGRAFVVRVFGMQRRSLIHVWDPLDGTLTSSSLSYPVWTATQLDDGRILLIGGDRESWAGIFDPTTGQTTEIKAPQAWRSAATRLVDGRVLIVGGWIDGFEHAGSMAPAASTVEIFR
jgi:hypothetical protein